MEGHLNPNRLDGGQVPRIDRDVRVMSLTVTLCDLPKI